MGKHVKQSLFALGIIAILTVGSIRISPSSFLAMLVTNPNELLNQINKQNTIERYSPSDLVELTSLGFKGKHIRSIVYPDLKRMLEDTRKQGLSLKIISSYRSYDQQQSLFARYFKKDKNANTYSAEAGHSEHELGTAIDFGAGEGSTDLAKKFANTAEGSWLASHSFEYGFLMSYPKGKEAQTGYIYEPWHFRFVGVRASTEAHSLNLSLQEYIEQKNDSLASTVATKTPYTGPRLVRASNKSPVYYITDKGYKHLIPNEQAFLSYGNSWNDVRTISDLELSAFPEILAITTQGNPNLYSISDGAKHLIPSASYGHYSKEEISIVNQTEFSSYLDAL